MKIAAKTLVAPALLSLVALAACQTPREACISDATRQLRQINSFIAETQSNLARGYGLEERERVEIERETCRSTVTDPNGNTTVIRTPCDRSRVVTERVPVPLNIPAEQARLESLISQQTALERQSGPMVQACIAAHPE